jgi:hypothetical protein
MTAIEKLQNKLNIKIDETYNHRMYDLEISTRTTADGYDVYVMKNTPYDHDVDIDWENSIFYYPPSFNDIMDRIMELDTDSEVYIDDIEEYLPEYEIERWINDNEDTDD